MNCLSEALGLALPGNGTIPAVSADRTILAREAGRAAVRAVRGQPHSAQDPHARGVPERGCPGHGAGRVDEHRAAPARHRRLRRGAPLPGRFRPPERAGPAPLLPRPVGAVLHAAPPLRRRGHDRAESPGAPGEGGRQRAHRDRRAAVARPMPARREPDGKYVALPGKALPRRGRASPC